MIQNEDTRYVRYNYFSSLMDGGAGGMLSQLAGPLGGLLGGGAVGGLMGRGGDAAAAGDAAASGKLNIGQLVGGLGAGAGAGGIVQAIVGMIGG